MHNTQSYQSCIHTHPAFTPPSLTPASPALSKPAAVVGVEKILRGLNAKLPDWVTRSST